MIFLAIRYLLERRRQTLLTLLGVFFGTTAYIVVSGFFLGFQGYLVEQLVNNMPQVHIEARQDYVEDHALDKSFFGDHYKHAIWAVPPSGMIGYSEVQDPQAWYRRLDADPRVEAFSPQLSAAVLFNLSKISVSASLVGCDPKQQAKVTNVSSFMINGKFEDIAVGGNRLIIGSELKRRLGVGLDQTVLVSIGTNNAQPFKVVGIYSTGNRMADMTAYASLADVQKLARMPNMVNEIGVRLHDYTQAASIAEQWSSVSSERVESWDQLYANVLSVFTIQTTLRYVMIATILIVASFGIYNILNMTVNQKRQDIAILRSMGYDSFDVVMLFFSQGIIVGVIGGIMGLFAGYLICLWLQTVSFMASTPASPSGHLHIAINLPIYVQGCLLALLSASVASILPARAAGKLTPIDIIRQGGG